MDWALQLFTMFFLTFWTAVNTVITFELLPVITSAINTAAMSTVSFQHDNFVLLDLLDGGEHGDHL